MDLTNENSLITVKRLSEYNEKLFGAQGTASESVLATDENGGHQGLISALDRKKINILYERAGLKDSVSFSSLSSNPAGGIHNKETTGGTYTVTDLIFNSVSVMVNMSSVTPTTSDLKFYYKKPGDTEYTEIQTISVESSGTTFTLKLENPIEINTSNNNFSISGKVKYTKLSLMSGEKSVSYTFLYNTYYGPLSSSDVTNLSNPTEVSGVIAKLDSSLVSESPGATVTDNTHTSWSDPMKYTILRPKSGYTVPSKLIDLANNNYTYIASEEMDKKDIAINNVTYEAWSWKNVNVMPSVNFKLVF